LSVKTTRLRGEDVGQSLAPNVEVTVHPPVYDPERFNRGVEVLARAYQRALLRYVQMLANGGGGP
jgi:hypothetical protein